MKFIVGPALSTLLLPTLAWAQQPAAAPWGAPPPPPATLVASAPPAAARDSMGVVPRARHAIYVSATSLVFLNSAGLNYGFRPLRGLAFSVGVGYAHAIALIAEVSSVGGQAMAHLLVGSESPHSFEVAAGLSVIETNARLLCDDCDGTRRVAALPAGFLGYRYQPLDGGFLFRVGGAWDLGLGIGLQASFGAAF